MSACWSREAADLDTAIAEALQDVLANYSHSRLTRARIAVARHIGPVFWPAWYIAPEWKRDKWHRIACELDPQDCAICGPHYGAW